MTQRRRLDAFLVEQAAATGAEFRDGVRVEDSRSATTASRRSSAALRPRLLLVGADGANGSSRARGARRRDRPRGRPRGQLPLGDLDGAVSRDGLDRVRRRPRRLRLGLPEGRPRERRRGRVARRKARGSARTSPAVPREHGLDPARSRTCAATGCRCADSELRPREDASCLVGDAAGLVDPVSGDGIYEAFVSARLASDALLAGRPEAYGVCSRPLSIGTRRCLEGQARCRSVSTGLPLRSARTGRVRRRCGALARRPGSPKRSAATRAAAASAAVAARAHGSTGSLI